MDKNYDIAFKKKAADLYLKEEMGIPNSGKKNEALIFPWFDVG
ncbi:hypothetical protein ABET52_19415 [Saccharococcus caldoxylosilyticus]